MINQQLVLSQGRSEKACNMDKVSNQLCTDVSVIFLIQEISNFNIYICRKSLIGLLLMQSMKRLNFQLRIH